MLLRILPPPLQLRGTGCVSVARWPPEGASSSSLEPSLEPSCAAASSHSGTCRTPLPLRTLRIGPGRTQKKKSASERLNLLFQRRRKAIDGACCFDLTLQFSSSVPPSSCRWLHCLCCLLLQLQRALPRCSWALSLARCLCALKAACVLGAWGRGSSAPAKAAAAARSRTAPSCAAAVTARAARKPRG